VSPLAASISINLPNLRTFSAVVIADDPNHAKVVTMIDYRIMALQKPPESDQSLPGAVNAAWTPYQKSFCFSRSLGALAPLREPVLQNSMIYSYCGESIFV
jgi:hypothetical protein